MSAVDHYSAGVPLWLDDRNGVPREYVPGDMHDRVVRDFQTAMADVVAFARAHGLTDEQWAEWTAS